MTDFDPFVLSHSVNGKYDVPNHNLQKEVDSLQKLVDDLKITPKSDPMDEMLRIAGTIGGANATLGLIPDSPELQKHLSDFEIARRAAQLSIQQDISE